MRHSSTLRAVVLTMCLAVSQARLCAEEWYSRGGVHYEHRLEVVLRNPLPVDRREEPVVLAVADIRKQAPDFPGKAWVVVDPAAEPDSPCGIEANGNDVPSQLEDLDGDGQPEELVFLADLPANSERTYYIYYTNKDLPMPRYPKRTQITTFAESDTNTLFAIESDRFMFRFAGAAKDSPGYAFDMFAKHKEYPGYYQHLFHRAIFARYGNWLTDTPRGRSILYPGDHPGQLGIGSLFIRKDGRILLPDRSNLECDLLVDGRVRSVGEIRVDGWKVGNNVYDATIRCAMYAGHPFMECDLTVARVAGNDPEDSPCVGMMKIEDEQKEAGKGYVLLWGNRPRIGVKDVGMAMMFDPNVFADAAETDKEYILALRVAPEPGKPAKARFFLSGAWGKAGYFASKEAFFDFHRGLGPALLNPPGVEVGVPESGPEKRDAEVLAKAELFLSNPSNKKSILPAECDVESLGLETGGSVSSALPVDTVPLYGRKRVFIDKSIDFLQTEKVQVAASAGKSKPSFDIKQADRDNDVTVTIGKTQWVISGQGLKRIVYNQKEMDIEQSGASGPVEVIHNGAVCAIVRVGDGEKYCDYYFYKDERVAKVVASTSFALACEGSRSYVAKKEVGVEGCEQTQSNRWGRIASEKVFGISSVFSRQPDNAQEQLRYPAEWGALYSDEKKVGLVFYGTPSVDRISVEKGGRMGSELLPGRTRQAIYLSPIEDVVQGEERWVLMSPPFVSVKTEGGYRSCEDRTSSGVDDTVFIEDLNADGMPDFVGDRWLFDVDSDDALQMILEFGDGEDRGRPGRKVREMRVYCDTVTGSRLHSSSLSAFWGDLPTEYPWTTYPEERGKYDGVLGPGELQRPFSVYQMTGAQDGVFFNGPVTEGSFVASGRITDAYGGPFYSACFVPDATLEVLDLDDDGDSDIWVVRAYGQQGIADHGPDSPVTVAIVHFDLSDNGLDPVTVINPYTGLAYWATRYSTMQSVDNSKYYQQGVPQEDGTIIGGRNWPMAGTWDVDNSGLPNAHLYHETARPVMALDLENRFSASHVRDPDKEQEDLQVQGCMGGRFRLDSEDLEWVREGWHFQKDMYPIRPFDFTLHAARLTDARVYHTHSADQPKCVYQDRHGNRVSIRARYLPEQWQGERLECKFWPDGQWDYCPSNNWNTFFHRSPWVCVSHFLRGWHVAHMEGAHDHVGFHAMARTEMAWADQGDPDGASSYYLYYSPILNGLHYMGLEFGLQYLPDFAPGNILYPIWGKSRQTAGVMASGKLFDYPRETRQWGTIFLYYLDRSGDGYVDTYVLDDENDGYFEKRAWHDRKNDLVKFYDGGRLGVVKTKVEFPGYTLELKNYNDLVALRRGSYEKEGLLWKLKIKDGVLDGGGDEDFSMVLSGDWLPQVAADAFHTKGRKDPWADFEETGLDTLGRVISQSEIVVSALNERYSSQSLSNIDLLVVSDISIMPEEDEVEALKAYLEGGGIVVLLAGAVQPEEMAPMVYLAKCFDVAVKKGVLSNVPKETELTREYRAGRGYLADPFRWGPVAEELGVKDRTGAGLLKGVKELFFDSRDAGPGEALIEHTGRPLVTSRKIGKGTLVVIPSNLFHNKYMCMDYVLRELLSEKAGNQSLAENLVAHLLRDKKFAVTSLECTDDRAAVGLVGKGGRVHFRVPWAKAAIQVNGKEEPSETRDGTVSVAVPAGTSQVVIMPKK